MSSDFAVKENSMYCLVFEAPLHGSLAWTLTAAALEYYCLEKTIFKTIAAGLESCDSSVKLVTPQGVINLGYTAFGWLYVRASRDPKFPSDFDRDLAQCVAQTLRTEFREDLADFAA